MSKNRSNGVTGAAVPPPAEALALKRFRVMTARAYQVYAENENEARRKTIECVRTGRDGPAAREVTVTAVEELPPVSEERPSTPAIGR